MQKPKVISARLAVKIFRTFPAILLASLVGPIFSSFSLAASFIPDGRATSKPYGHVAFCKANPKDCRAVQSAKVSTIKPEVLSAGRFADLKKINTKVNTQIKPVSDQQSAGVADVWSASVKSGDCEDYALSKRNRLLNAGFNPANLRLAMARIPSGIAHLVLVVRTNKGDLVLDNLKNDIKVWNQTGYRFVKIQMSGGSREWLAIGN